MQEEIITYLTFTQSYDEIKRLIMNTLSNVLIDICMCVKGEVARHIQVFVRYTFTFSLFLCSRLSYRDTHLIDFNVQNNARQFIVYLFTLCRPCDTPDEMKHIFISRCIIRVYLTIRKKTSITSLVNKLTPIESS